jgi:MFS family permease
MSHEAGPIPFARLPRNLAPLGYRDYLLFFFGLLASNMGRWIEQTGAVWLVYELTASPVLLGLLGVAKAAPTLLLGPLGGVVADRVDQRRALFVTQGLLLTASLILGLLVVSGRVEVWHVYVEVAAVSVISAVDVSVRQAIFPRLVPHHLLSEAVTLTSTATRSSALIGPALGGVAIAGLGVAAPVILNGATYLALMAAVVMMRTAVLPLAALGAPFRQDLVDGLRHIWRQPILSGLLKMELVFGGLQMNPVMITIVGREILDVGPEGLGGLLSAPALGALTGIVALLLAGHVRRQGRFALVCQMLYAAALVLFALSTEYVVSFLLLAATGLLDTLITVTRLSVAQLAAPPHMRGRVMANMRMVTGGIGPLSQTQSGLVAGAIGAPLALIGAAAALSSAAVVTARANVALWTFDRASPSVEIVSQVEPGDAPT